MAVLAVVATYLALTELQAAAKNNESRLSISDAITMNRMLSSRKHTPHRIFFILVNALLMMHTLTEYSFAA